jgi:ubiquinone/menaquinone biosynthesis C-methylase UbiE
VGRLQTLCYKIYWSFEQLIVPGLRNSQYLYKEVLEAHVPRGGRWLELGCGHQILPDWMACSNRTETSLVGRTGFTAGLDPAFLSIRSHPTIQNRVVSTIEHSPFKEKTFDLITANMVVEHLQNPTAALSEVCRLLKPGGTLILHTTNFLNYQCRIAGIIPQGIKNRLIRFLEGRSETDVFPTAYKINTVREIEEVTAKSGFRILELKTVSSTAATALLFPIAILELMIIRLLECSFAWNYRSNIIAILQKT